MVCYVYYLDSSCGGTNDTCPSATQSPMHSKHSPDDFRRLPSVAKDLQSGDGDGVGVRSGPIT